MSEDRKPSADADSSDVTKSRNVSSRTTTEFTSAPPGLDAPFDPAQPEESEERYIDLALIGKGGMGEVRRVRDKHLNRVLAMKILRSDKKVSESRAARFYEEAQVTAQLQHPAIVPLHDYGRLPDGRLFFTMKEIQGRTFRNVIDDIHEAHQGGTETDNMSPDFGWRETADGWSFRRLMQAFQLVCECVAYAHSRGVIHRDIKPDNLMVGDYGEVLVLDWGLTRVGVEATPDESHDEVVTDRSSSGTAVTQYGVVAGTPAYMPPEQAQGDPTLVDKRSDVYALGATLYHILSGRRPYADVPEAVWFRGGAPPTPLSDRVGATDQGPVIPAELRRCCEQAMNADPGQRQTDAGELARQLAAWLDGAQRRAMARTLLNEARQLEPEVARLRMEGQKLRRGAHTALLMIPPFAEVEAKLGAWADQDRAQKLELEAELASVRMTQLLRAALSHADDYEPAHQMLAAYYQQRHADAEAGNDLAGVARFEALLRHHDRGRWVEYLKGEGTLDLVTNPAGAMAKLWRCYPSDLYRYRGIPDISGLCGETPAGVLIMSPVQPASFIDDGAAKNPYPDGDDTKGDDGWACLSGTSAAAPQIAGIAALVLGTNSSVGGPEAVRAILELTARDVVAGKSNPKTGKDGQGYPAGPGRDFATGAGLARASHAVLLAALLKYAGNATDSEMVDLLRNATKN